MQKTIPAVLVLADGTSFTGRAVGVLGQAVGEVVFNTALTGYQEILTDPSYFKQLVTLTYPMIGNVGINEEDQESSRLFASGLIIRSIMPEYSNFRAKMSLSEYLVQHNVVAIADVDTRRLTRVLREKGAQGGCIMAGEIDTVVAQAQARAFGSLAGQDLACQVTCVQAYSWNQAEWCLEVGYPAAPTARYRVVVYDFGVKHTILRLLVQYGCRVSVVPAMTPVADVLALKPDGVLLSNGPGDPEPCTYAITAIQQLLAARIPLFGICLGHQLLGLACGARTRKMKFGHHGANHPVQHLQSQKVFITSQNHGFELDETSLPSTVRITHRSLFDGSVQGIELLDRPAFSFQGHPEASPGPSDIALLFKHFTDMMSSLNSKHGTCHAQTK